MRGEEVETLVNCASGIAALCQLSVNDQCPRSGAGSGWRRSRSGYLWFQGTRSTIPPKHSGKPRWCSRVVQDLKCATAMPDGWDSSTRTPRCELFSPFGCFRERRFHLREILRQLKEQLHVLLSKINGYLDNNSRLVLYLGFDCGYPRFVVRPRTADAIKDLVGGQESD